MQIFTISQQYCPSPDLEPPPCDAVLEPFALRYGVTPGHDGQVTWTALVDPKFSLCGQTVRLHSDNCRHFVLHHSRTVRFERLPSQPTTQNFLSLSAIDRCSTG